MWLYYIIALFWINIYFTKSEDLDYNLCKNKTLECIGPACDKTLRCYHGICTEDGLCKCDPCYHGKHCKEYNDKHHPLFKKTSDLSYVSISNVDNVIYLAKADDQDVETSCYESPENCPCATFRYMIVDGEDDVYVNSKTGEVYFQNPETRKPGDQIVFTVGVLPLKKHYVTSTIWVTVNVAEIESDKEIPGNSLDRKKRESEPGQENNGKTTFAIVLKDGEHLKVELGKTLHYSLDIYLPQTDKLDLQVEIFTRDFGDSDYNPTLALFNVTMEKQGSISYLDGQDPKLQLQLSEIIPNVYERVYIDFGNMKNVDENSTISIEFSIVMVRNVDTKFDKIYYVTVGAEFDNHTTVWVGQSEIRIIRPEEETRSVEVDVVSPETIAIETAGIFKVDAYLSIRSDLVQLETVLDKESSKYFSLGHIVVIAFGEHYQAIPQDIYHYNRTRLDSDNNELTFHKAVLELGLVTNIGPYGQAAKEEENKIEMKFLVFVLKTEGLPAKGSVTVSLKVAEQVMWTKVFSFSVTPYEVKQPGNLLESSSKSDREMVSGGDLVVLTIESHLEGPGFFDYLVEVHAPNDTSSPHLQPCSGRAIKDGHGFNIPFVNSTLISPGNSDSKYVFDFGRVQVTDQVATLTKSDCTVRVKIIFTVQAGSKTPNGTQLTPTIFISSSGPKGELKEFKPTPVTVVTRTDLQVPSLKLNNAATWSNLYQGGAVVMNLTIGLLPGASYNEVFLEIVGPTPEKKLPDFQVCNARIFEVGNEMPCLILAKDTINDESTYYISTDNSTKIPNLGRMVFGTMSALQTANENQKDRELQVVIAAGLPVTSPVKNKGTYSITVGLGIGKQTIWSAVANYTLSPTTPSLKKNDHPAAVAKLRSEGLFRHGQALELELEIKTNPLTVGQYEIELSSDSAELQICALRVNTIGENLPCLDGDTLAEYTHKEPKSSGSLFFAALSNLGYFSRKIVPSVEDNILKLNSIVLISPNAIKNKSISWTLNYGSKRQLNGAVPVPLAGKIGTAAEMEYSEPKSITVTPEAETVSFGKPFFMSIEFEFDLYAVAPIVIKVGSDGQKTSPYQICHAGLSFHGNNYPCLKQKFIEIFINSSNVDQPTQNNSITYNLGTVCHTFTTPDPMENRMRVGAVVVPMDDGKTKNGDKFTMITKAMIGEKEMTIGSSQLTIERSGDDMTTYENATIKPKLEKVNFKLRERKWIQFVATIPRESVVKLVITAEGSTADERAIMTLHGFRIISTGPNIPCKINLNDDKVVITSTVKTNQTTKIRADLGYIANTGASHTLRNFRPGDDDLIFEVETELTDHPATTAGSKHELSLTATMSGTTLEVKQILDVVRTGTELVEIAVDLKVMKEGPIKQGEKVTVMGSVSLSDESVLEPMEASLQLHLPPYITFLKMTYDNISKLQKPVLKNHESWLEIKIPFLLYMNNLSLSLTFQADPNNSRGFGAGHEYGTIPYHLLCKLNNVLSVCGPMDYIMLEIDNEECLEELGVGSGTVQDCQIQSSTSSSPETEGKYGRVGSSGAWSLPIKTGVDKPYWQVDFLKMTRVSQILVDNVEGTRKLEKYSLSSSLNGVDWLPGLNISSLSYDGKSALSRVTMPSEARFIKLYVEQTEKEKEFEKYMGVQFELYGCSLGTQSGVCDESGEVEDSTQSSLNSKREFVSQHFAADPKKNTLFYCDASNVNSLAKCHYAENGGQIWQKIQWAVGRILGYDKERGIAIATDIRNKAYLTSSDNKKWIAISEEKAQLIMTNGTFVPSSKVPPVTIDEITELKLKQGKWKASFFGLHFGESEVPNVLWL